MGQASTIGLTSRNGIARPTGPMETARLHFASGSRERRSSGFCRSATLHSSDGGLCRSALLGPRARQAGSPVRLIPPAYVKPYVKRQKNDMADAETICEAAQRPSMRFGPVKSEAQQANGVVFRARDLLVRQRTQCINALRGHLSEYGYVFPQGITQADTLISCVEDPDTLLPQSARAVLTVLVATYTALEAQVRALDAEIARRAKADPVARRLMTVPGMVDRGYSDHGARASAGGLPGRTRFRRVAWAHAVAKIQRRKAEARRRVEAGRTDHPASADPWREGGRALGQSARQARRILAGANAGAQTEMLVTVALANRRARIVGAAGQGRRVLSSGRGGISR